MPYVPGFSQDIFISYASEDVKWVQEFQNLLAEALIDRGLEAEFWRDRENIRFGQNWKDEMFKAVERTAIFLAILSPNYRNSDYCNDESDYFQALRERHSDLKIGDLCRYLKVVKTAWEDDGHRALLAELNDIEFFTRDPRHRIDSPLPFTSQEFGARIRNAAHSIEATLKAMRRLRELVYVASPAEDVQQDWKDLRAELNHQGYVVGPAAKLNRGLAPEFIRKEFKHAVLAIHLLGSEYHPLAERQLDLCAESGQRMAVWIKKGADEDAGEQQRSLLRAVRDFEKIPKGTPLLEGTTGRAPVHDLLELLKPAPRAAASGSIGAAGPTIYLICDPTVDEDRGFAHALEQSIEQNEKMQVVLPHKDTPLAHERHQQMLRECDGVLLYRDKAPEPWFFQYVHDVARAEKILKRPPIRSKAILTSEDDLEDLAAPASVRLIGRGRPFALESLEPFLAPLRASGSMEAANAGN